MNIDFKSITLLSRSDDVRDTSADRDSKHFRNFRRPMKNILKNSTRTSIHGQATLNLRAVCLKHVVFG